MPVSTSHIVTERGLSLAADMLGDPNQPAVVLLHGGGQLRHSWRGTMLRLAAAGYHVIAYDARGHGDSDWSPDGDYSLPALASDLRSVLATLPRPATLVGASMGGMTSFYAIGTGSPAAGLVMVDVVLRPNPSGAERILRFMTANPDGFETLEEAAAAVAAYNPDRPRPSDISGLRRNLRLQEDGRLHWHWDPRLLATRPTAEPPTYTDHLLSVASKVRVPTLLVRGGHSDVVDDDGVAEMRALVPQMKLADVPGAGNMVAGDRNDAFCDAVIAFLEELHAASGR